jgi:hypothetical protein
VIAAIKMMALVAVATKNPASTLSMTGASPKGILARPGKGGNIFVNSAGAQGLPIPE